MKKVSKYFLLHNSFDDSYTKGTIKELGIDTTQYADYDEDERRVLATLQDFIDNASVGDQHSWEINAMGGETGTLTLLEL